MIANLDGALCAQPGVDPDDWFPRKGDKAAAQRARAVCKTCPVATACLTLALDAERDVTSHRFGVYGATTANQRHTNARARRAA